MVIITDANGNPTEVAGNFLTSEDLESISNTVSLLDNKIAEFSQRVSYIESIEVIYDKDDPLKDWGYYEGLQNGYVITGKDLSKYKKIKGYWYLFGAPSGTFEVDLTGYLTNTCRGFTQLNTDAYNAGLIIAPDTGDITVNTEEATTGSSYIYKIEGVY